MIERKTLKEKRKRKISSDSDDCEERLVPKRRRIISSESEAEDLEQNKTGKSKNPFIDDEAAADDFASDDKEDDYSYDGSFIDDSELSNDKVVGQIELPQVRLFF